MTTFARVHEPRLEELNVNSSTRVRAWSRRVLVRFARSTPSPAPSAEFHAVDREVSEVVSADRDNSTAPQPGARADAVDADRFALVAGHSLCGTGRNQSRCQQ